MKRILPVLLLLFVLQISAQTKRTFTYAVKGKDTLKLDVYTPEILRPNDSLPVLLWMHGGGFAGGTRDNAAEQKLCEYVANRGYIGISISYRLLRKNQPTGFGCDCDNQEKINTFKQAVIDYFDAAKYIVKNAKSLQIDTSKLIAGGSSAGAEAILNAVFMRSYFIDDLKQYNDINFAGVLSLAGALVNVDYITKSNALPSVLFHGTDDNLVPFATAPHHYCDPSKAGYLILDGSATIAEKLSELEVAYYFHKVKGGRHELSSIQFNEFDNIFDFFAKTVLNSEVIQTKIIKQKKP
ncbi:alpha/beta hydrolase [Geojedonia litorea]|uniref:Alpha/beta hydrolase n=1 Tax=Geojedonia litorea TaxID=1268269 RepID=A0ABV9N4S0_9FLAO